ncbi:MAG: PPC domain-containing protein [Microcystaceae cyanobacterium]
MELPLQAQQSLYQPIPIPSDYEVSDTLSERDIPTGEGGFARDYTIELKEGEQVAIDVISDNFDAIVILLGDDGVAIAENDDGPDGSTNSLLFSRITESGKYIIRVRSFGETGNGKFTLKVTRLSPK